MTPPTPAWYVKGSWPGSFVDQNFWPDYLTTPVAWTVAVEPFVISLPEPGVIVRIVVPLQPGAGVISAIVTCGAGASVVLALRGRVCTPSTRPQLSRWRGG